MIFSTTSICTSAIALLIGLTVEIAIQLIAIKGYSTVTNLWLPAQCPLSFEPLVRLEWHGVHNVPCHLNPRLGWSGMVSTWWTPTFDICRHQKGEMLDICWGGRVVGRPASRGPGRTGLILEDRLLRDMESRFGRRLMLWAIHDQGLSVPIDTPPPW